MVLRRIQFSLAEMLAIALACGALATIYSMTLSEIDDKREVSIYVVVSMFFFATISFCLIASAEGRWRFISIAALFALLAGMSLSVREKLIGEQLLENEKSAVAFCAKFCDAQRSFLSKYTYNGMHRYAQSLRELTGSREVGDSYLVSKVYAEAEVVRGAAKQVRGYCFKVLHRNDGGTSDRRQDHRNDKLEGFEMVAYPAAWGATEKNAFLVDHSGVIYKRDLGKSTSEQVEHMTQFNPDAGWIVVEYCDPWFFPD